MPVTVEGIEDAATYDAVTDFGCAVGQGWYFGKPMAAEDVAHLLRDRGTAAAAGRAPRKAGWAPFHRTNVSRAGQVDRIARAARCQDGKNFLSILHDVRAPTFPPVHGPFRPFGGARPSSVADAALPRAGSPTNCGCSR